MAIWISDPMTFARERWRHSLIGHLGIELVEAGEDYLKARMPVDERTRTPAGALHGGAALALAETVAGWAGSSCVDPTRRECVPLEVSGSHLRAVVDGVVFATARPLYLGEAAQVWEVRVVSDREVTVSVARVTLTLRDVPHWH